MSEKKINSYTKSFDKHDGGIRSLQWAGYKAAATRFTQLTGDFPLHQKAILDVGCGFGDLIPFISKEALDFTYTGIDLIAQFTDEATKRYPEHTFQTGDFFAAPEGMFDVVFCSGALNGRGDDPLGERTEKIATLFTHTREVLAFNMAGGASPHNKETGPVFYADSAEILSFCLTLTPKVIFKQHYHPKDFTIIMFK